MKIFEDFYAYPWISYQENNCNTLFIDGTVPVIIDPGHAHLFDHVAQGMAKDGKSIESIRMALCTHGHPDHIEALDRFDDGVVRAISREEHAFLANGYRDLYLGMGIQTPVKPFKVFLKEGTLKLGDKKTFTVLFTPGHSPGGICFYWHEKKALISGDTVFYMGVGRSDLYGGDSDLLAQSIARLSKLDVEYLIPGHGDMVKGKKTIEKNFEAIMRDFF